MYIKDIQTFEEFEKYYNTVNTILNLIEANKDNDKFNRRSIDYDYNSNLHITKRNVSGVDSGYSLDLYYNSEQVACSCHYNLDSSDESWVKRYGNGVTHMYGFSEYRPLDYEYDRSDREPGESSVRTKKVLPYISTEECTEEMFFQYQLIHTLDVVSIMMLMSKLCAGNRQFVLFEYKPDYNITYDAVLKELKKMIGE